MKKLMSMVDFVLENIKKNTSKMQLGGVATSLHEISSYAKFLQQVPTLGIFVPCDEDGNVLEKPKKVSYIDCTAGDHENIIKYQQAEQRVIFEGWLIQSKDNLQTVIYDQNMDNIFLNIDGTILYNNQPIKTIEDLVPYNLIMK